MCAAAWGAMSAVAQELHRVRGGSGRPFSADHACALHRDTAPDTNAVLSSALLCRASATATLEPQGLGNRDT